MNWGSTTFEKPGIGFLQSKKLKSTNLDYVVLKPVVCFQILLRQKHYDQSAREAVRLQV